MSAPSDDPKDLDRQNPEAEIAARAEAYRNCGRWGEDDRLGTLNFIDAGKRVEAASLITDGIVECGGERLTLAAQIRVAR